jgi:hypothetical protein
LAVVAYSGKKRAFEDQVDKEMGTSKHEARDVRFWHLADIAADSEHVRFWG